MRGGGDPDDLAALGEGVVRGLVDGAEVLDVVRLGDVDPLGAPVAAGAAVVADSVMDGLARDCANKSRK